MGSCRAIGRGFTLIELLVTVLVMVILMAISFRLMHSGDEAVARSRTQDRLQRLQNCLSGYRAAFGHYPAVPLHGERDIYLEANDYGIQTSHRTSKVVWRNVRAAILSQPVTTEFPFDAENKDVKTDIAEASAADVAWSKAAKSHGGDATAVAVYAKGYKPFSASLVAAQKNLISWRDVQIFRFGLLSFLLPRACFMFFGENLVYEKYAQWPAQNELAEYYDPETGKPLKSSWSSLVAAMRTDCTDRKAILASRSQAACARWLPNLEGIVRGGGSYFCIDTSDGKAFRERDDELRDAEAADLMVHATGKPEAPKTAYVLDGLTVLDGWENEFYYYSPAPHRTCRIWSAGSDRKTLPPWIDPAVATSDPELKKALVWTRDDFVSLLQ